MPEAGDRRALLELARLWHAAGCVVAAVRPDGSKYATAVAGGGADLEPDVLPATFTSGPRAGQPHPRAGQPNPRAGQYRYGWKRIATGEHVHPLAEVLRAIRSGRSDGVGVFTGRASGTLEMVELEARAVDLLPRLAATAAERGLAELWSRLNAGCTEWSAGGGIHFFLRCPDVELPGNTRLAMRADPDPDKPPQVLSETRSTGGWVVVAGSFGRTHASGRPYRMRSGSPLTIPTLTADERRAVLELFASLDELPAVTRPAVSAAPPARRERPAGDVLPGDDFNARASWDEILTGWRRCGTDGERTSWTRPDKAAGVSATTTDSADGSVLYVFSTSTPLPAGVGLSKFAALAHLRHGGDFSAAAAELYATGYGSRAEAPPGGAALPEPGRVETFTPAPVVPLDELRADLRHDLERIARERPRLAVFSCGTAAGKTTAATELVPPLFDRVTFNVGSHELAAAVVGMLHEAGHADAMAMPRLDEDSCAAYTDEAAAALAAEHGTRAGVSMERAMRVGMPMLACRGCPLSGMGRNAAPDRSADLDFLTESGWTVHEAETATGGCSCEYRRRVSEAQSARVTVQCHERTRRNPGALRPRGEGELAETIALVTDENAMDVLHPRVLLLPEDVRAVADGIGVAAGNHAIRVARMRFTPERARAHELASWGTAVADVARRIADLADELAAAGKRGVFELPDGMAVDRSVRPEAPLVKLATLLAKADLPTGWKPEAYELVRAVATGNGDGVRFTVTVEPDGTAHTVVHRTWETAIPAGVTHIVLDADADMAAIRRLHPDAVTVEPRGVAPLRHPVRQVWEELTPRTHPRRYVELLEWGTAELGGECIAVAIPKRVADVLFPRTRPRHGRPEDKPADVARIAGWQTGGGGRSAATLDRRMAEAADLVRRLEAIRPRLARDEHGRLRVIRHRGSIARGSNACMDEGVRGLLVLGQTRIQPDAVAGYLLATGQGDAVAAGAGGWGWCGGELPDEAGTPRTVRWRSYTCPRWAAAAERLNRAELRQTVARSRANLDGGVPAIVVAAEPLGVPLTAGPVRDRSRRTADRLTARLASRATCGIGGVTGADELSATSAIGHTPAPSLIANVADNSGWFTAGAIVAALGAPERTARRWLAAAVASGRLERTGEKRGTRYRLATGATPAPVGRQPVAVTAAAPPPPPPAPQVHDPDPEPAGPADLLPELVVEWEPGEGPRPSPAPRPVRRPPERSPVRPTGPALDATLARLRGAMRADEWHGRVADLERDDAAADAAGVEALVRLFATGALAAPPPPIDAPTGPVA